MWGESVNEKFVLYLFKMFFVYIVIKIISKILYKLKKKIGLYFEYIVFLLI